MREIVGRLPAQAELSCRLKLRAMSSYERIRAAGSKAWVAIMISSAWVEEARSSMRDRTCSGVPMIARCL